MRRSLTLLVAAFALASCGSGDASDPYIQASFDGGVWQATAQEGEVVYTVDDPYAGGKIFAIASREIGGGAQFIALNLPVPPTPGTVRLDGAAASAAFASCPGGDAGDCIYWRAVSAHAGTLTIDRVDASSGLVEGTFAFTGYLLGNPDGSAKIFSSGRFRIYAPGAFTG